MGVADVPQCASFSSYHVWERMVRGGWESWVCFGSRTNSSSGGHVISCLIPNMASIMESICSFKPTCRLSSVPISPLGHPSS
ncbi:hypothetical protein GmHk_14G041456 [Glycine max]|nr:hypothetical protein GmHk_14G041456 [Glycine max]